MKIGEILRTIADAMDRADLAQSVPQARDDLQNTSCPEAPPETSPETDNAEDPEDLFLPPLQAKMELLKKAVGVENVYDDGSDADQEEGEYVGAPDTETDSGHEDELAVMKRRAGINPVVAFELSDDEPLES